MLSQLPLLPRTAAWNQLDNRPVIPADHDSFTLKHQINQLRDAGICLVDVYSLHKAGLISRSTGDFVFRPQINTAGIQTSKRNGRRGAALPAY